ncbi:hypothetical protein H257_16739 [Aphanomyces astaci]|uniref:Uncharacterized protein n=1 Tax=Aphanomyces astaci TaxID=112090 RepID=W4FJB3_APHAT|nr:hypothetical protein H257_16739 [Aphanomyces astaci]ETV66936.1 hypothetical protein H257_16739 [Aphanomyces astaci]|eukprot:XP_009843577.1 hypothetical protein H257_16739 [Aphanomyces astaci]
MSSQNLLKKPSDGGMDDNGITTHKWKVSLFGCLDTLVPNTLMTVIFPCVSVAQIAARVGFVNYLTALIVTFVAYILFLVAIGVHTTALDVIAALVGIVSFGYLWYMRTKVRFLFHIPGSIVEDGCVVLFCGWCSIAQIATHVESYTPNECAFDAKATLPGYIV